MLSVSDAPTWMVVADLMLIAVTSISVAGAFTVTVHVPDFVLSRLEVAVMVAVPCATAVTKPVELTVATLGALLVHVTVLSASSGDATTVAVNCCTPLMSKVAVAGETVTLVTVGVSGVGGVLPPPRVSVMEFTCVEVPALRTTRKPFAPAGIVTSTAMS